MQLSGHFCKQSVNVNQILAEFIIFYQKKFEFFVFGIDFSTFFGYNICRNARSPEHTK